MENSDFGEPLRRPYTVDLPIVMLIPLSIVEIRSDISANLKVSSVFKATYLVYSPALQQHRLLRTLTELQSRSQTLHYPLLCEV